MRDATTRIETQRNVVVVGGIFCSAALSNMRVGEAESRRTGAVVVEGKCRRSQNNRESRMNFAIGDLARFQNKKLT
jgi:hypothetical protein